MNSIDEYISIFSMGNLMAHNSIPEIYTFKIGNNKFCITSEEMNQCNVDNCGLVNVLKGEGFKDIPPEVPRDEEGCIILNRNPDNFELLLRHIKGTSPLNDCNLTEFDSKFESLFDELLYWNMPLNDINIPLRIWTDSSWMDGKAIFPLADKMVKCEKEIPDFVHIIKLKKAAKSEYFSENFSSLIKDSEHGTFLTGVYGSDSKIEIYADSKLLLVSISNFIKNPLMQFGDYELGKSKSKKTNKTTSFVIHPSKYQFLLILTPGVFVHIIFDPETRKSECVTYRREERWICIHPLSGLVISGVRPGIPYIYSFDTSEEISLVKFFPWGAVAIYKNVHLTSKKTIKKGEKEEVLNDDEKRLINNFEESKLGSFLNNASEEYSLPVPKCAAKIFRKNNSSEMPNYFKLYFANTSGRADDAITLSHIKDFDLVDRKLSDNTFICYCMINGALVSLKSENSEGSDIIGLNEGYVDKKQKCVLIKTGCPRNETLSNFFSIAEYSPSEEKYYYNPACMKMIEIKNKAKVSKETWDICTIM